MSNLRRRAAALALTAFFAPIIQAENINSDLVVVTATRFQQESADRPIAVQIITAEEIRNSAATTVSEVLSKTGGVQTRINFTGIPDAPLDLRGFGITGDQNTLVLVNGQRISEFEGNTPARLSGIPIDAIERIEILRGSGTVLYGEGATAGTINIITRSPLAESTSGNATLLTGSHDQRDLRAGFQTSHGQWGVSLYGQHYENDNYRDHNRAKLDAFSGELRYGDESGFIALNINADRQKAQLPGARTEQQLSTDRDGATTPEDYLDTDSQIYTLRGEKRLGDFTLALDVGRRSKQGESFGSGTYQFFGTQRYTTSADTDLDVNTVSPRVMWKSDWNGINNRLTVGLDWNDWTYKRDTTDTDTLFGNANTNETGDQTNRAFYIRDEISLSTGTRLSLGGRREHVDQDISLLTDSFAYPNREVSDTHHLSAYEIAMQQDLAAGFSAYGRMGRSYRLADIDENRCYLNPCPALLKPQRSFDREVGMEWSVTGTRLRLGLFQMDIDDEIYYMFVNAVSRFGATINLPPTRHRGVELELDHKLTDSLDLGFNFTHTQAEFKEGTFGGADVTGNDVPLVPDNRAVLNLAWRITSATRMAFSVTHVGNQRYDNDQANRFEKMPSYTVADIKLSHDWKNWTLAAGINNLFDKKYYSYGVVNGAYTTFNAYPEDERNGYVSLEYQF